MMTTMKITMMVNITQIKPITMMNILVVTIVAIIKNIMKEDIKLTTSLQIIIQTHTYTMQIQVVALDIINIYFFFNKNGMCS